MGSLGRNESNEEVVGNEIKKNTDHLSLSCPASHTQFVCDSQGKIADGEGTADALSLTMENDEVLEWSTQEGGPLAKP